MTTNTQDCTPRLYDVSKMTPGDTFKVTPTIQRTQPTHNDIMVYHSTKLFLYVDDCLTYLGKDTLYDSNQTWSKLMKFFLSREQRIVEMTEDSFCIFAVKNNVLAPSWYLKKVL